jgi:DNA (cytosine-5)-methyltransferase 1
MNLGDSAFLRGSIRPDYEQLPDPVVVVDLFAGCGGLTLGLAEAARRVGRGIDLALAVDFDPDIIGVYSANFPKANALCTRVEALFDGELGAPMTMTEESTIREIGQTDWLVGGPPCQGHSDLNNHTRRADPRNRLYERMARAAEILRPYVVLIENVPAVRNDRLEVVDQARVVLGRAGYVVADAVVSLSDIGVPQRRRRHVLLAIREGVAVDPAEVLATIEPAEPRPLRWAIGDLEDASDSPLDIPSKVSEANRARIQWLFANGAYDLPNRLRPPCHRGDHSYVSMYGRLRWDEPAQTITTGFGSMGQGRYVHPSRPRTLTPHEAARLQFFPDWFDFTGGGRVMKRGTWATMIGNAVPPKLTIELGRRIIPLLP